MEEADSYGGYLSAFWDWLSPGSCVCDRVPADSCMGARTLLSAGHP